MNATPLEAMELAALMCSRVCHDVISPVGAITNGLEILEDEDDEQMRGFALELIRKSAKQASAKLQFARLAFGAAGSAGAQIDLGDAQDVTSGFIGREKVTLHWTGPRENRPKDEVKLLLNMILVGLTTIPRGGDLSVGIDESSIVVLCAGEGANIPAGTSELLDGTTDVEGIDPRSVQIYFTGRVAGEAGMMLDIQARDGEIQLTARSG